jgi:hypothetical protein
VLLLSVCYLHELDNFSCKTSKIKISLFQYVYVGVLVISYIYSVGMMLLGMVYDDLVHRLVVRC